MSIICKQKIRPVFRQTSQFPLGTCRGHEKSTHLGAFSCSAAFLRSGEICVQLKKENMTNTEESSEETRLTTVIWVLIEGPAVSLKGSPTVSPMTAAL